MNEVGRFEVGSLVRMVGGIAEHYAWATAVVVAVRPHPAGLSHLNKYRVLISEGGEETFYEFQLGHVSNETMKGQA
jgi:hypothetical protein